MIPGPKKPVNGMPTLREGRIAWLVLLVVVLASAIALWPELSISRVDLNDNVFHFTLIERMAQALEHGENPLDTWSPEWTLGYPVLRTYQPLAHLLVIGAWLVLGKSVSLMTVFVWARFFSVLLLPVSFFAAARWFGLRPLTAAAAALLAPLVSTNFLYGIEYGSFTWAGSGLYPQAVAANFLLLSLGSGFRALRTGRRLTLAGILLGLTFLAHFIYGYIGALSLALLTVIPDAAVAWTARRGVVWVGVAAAALAAFEIAPLLIDGTINHSRWEFVGSGILRRCAGAAVAFHRRIAGSWAFPVLTALAFAGAAWFAFEKWTRRKPAKRGLPAIPGPPTRRIFSFCSPRLCGSRCFLAARSGDRSSTFWASRPICNSTG